MGAKSAIQMLPREWKEELARLSRRATGDLMIVTPYFTSFGTQIVANSLSARFAARGKITFLTDLSPSNICAGAAQPAALVALQSQALQFQVIHLSNLHAKVYVADNRWAIVTSGNLTAGGLVHNHEYGVLIQSEHIISQIREDIEELAALGAQITSESLQTYAQIAKELVTKYERKIKSARSDLAREFEQAFQQAEDELVAFRLAGGPITTVFERTVLYLLRKHGPLSTQQIHAMIQAIHPDLCDDSVDRVINGQHFGKKWKHAVRRAQSHLKDRGDIERVQGLWRIK